MSGDALRGVSVIVAVEGCHFILVSRAHIVAFCADGVAITCHGQLLGCPSHVLLKDPRAYN